MNIGIELGWRAIRIITVGTQNEILSINDVAQPAVVSTPPVVALSDGGALVGQAAIDLLQDEQQAGNLVIGHALAGLGDSTHRTELLAILLEKIGRDIEGFGSTRSNVTFIVADDIIARDERGDEARRQLAQAAAWANFKNPSLLYRIEAAAREGLDTYTEAELKARTATTLPVVRTLVIDAGPLGLSVSKLGIVFADSQYVAPTTGRVSWTEPRVAPDGRTEERSTTLSFDMFRHFAQTVEGQTGARFPAPAMDRIWELVRNPNSPPFQPVIDSTGMPHLFDVVDCRRRLANAVKRELSGLLPAVRASSSHSFVFIGGQYAAIAEVNKAIRDACDTKLESNLYFTELPAHGVAGAVRFSDLSPIQLKLHGALPSTPASLADLQSKPINDGEVHAPVVNAASASATVPEPKLLESIVASASFDPTRAADGPREQAIAFWGKRVAPAPFDVARGAQEAGRQVGVFWVEKIDRLLRLRATAPTVALKEYYERHLTKAGIAEAVQRAPDQGRASWWDRLFGLRAADADASPSALYLKPALVDELVKEIQKFAEQIVLDPATTKTNILESFRTATEFHDADQLVTAEYFAPYVDLQRQGALPAATATTEPPPPHLALTLFNGHGRLGANRPTGIDVTERVVLREGGVAATGPSGQRHYHDLGYTSEGFRSLLASSSKTVRRWQFGTWFRWLMGGHISVGQLVGTVVLFGVVLTLALVSIDRALQPTVLHASIDRGTFDCAVPDQTNVTCAGSSTATFGANSRFHDGCYLNVLRLVLPAEYLAYGVESVFPNWRPPLTHGGLVCQETYGFDMLATMNDAKALDKVTTTIRSAFSADQSPDLRFAWRNVYFNTPPDPNAVGGPGPVRMLDVAWISAAPPREGIALEQPLTFVVSDSPYSNTVDNVVNSGLCVDMGARLRVVPLGSDEDPAKQLTSILSDSPGKDVGFVRFAVAGKANAAPIGEPLTSSGLFLPRTAPADPAAPVPPERGAKLMIYPDLEGSVLAQPSPGLGRPRLVGTCS